MGAIGWPSYKKKLIEPVAQKYQKYILNFQASREDFEAKFISETSTLIFSAPNELMTAKRGISVLQFFIGQSKPTLVSL